MPGKPAAAPEREARRPAVEWIVGALSCVAVAALVVFLLDRAMFHDARPPDLSVAIEAIERGADGAMVSIAVRNDGDEAAAGVRVRAGRVAGGDGEADGEIELDYVAGHAVRRGTFVFADAAIAEDGLRIRIVGFIEP